MHDCFTLTELLTYEDLGLCEKGSAKEHIASGTFALDGELPVNTDGGLKTFGHPTGATGVRMIYENYKQLQGKAGDRQVKNADAGAQPQHRRRAAGLRHHASSARRERALPSQPHVQGYSKMKWIRGGGPFMLRLSKHGAGSSSARYEQLEPSEDGRCGTAASRTQPGKKRLPRFKSLDALVEFFDHADLGEYWDSTSDARFDVHIKKRTHLVAIDADLAQKLAVIARSKRTSPEGLVDSWLREKISEQR